MKLIKEFKDFAMRGNVVDMAVGVVVGGAFGKIVTSLVNDLIMPPLGLITGGMDFTDLAITLKRASADATAVTLNYGAFISTLINFVIIAASIFLAVRGMNALLRKQPAPPPAPSEKLCPECQMAIPLKAKRCGHCAVAVA